MAPVARLDAAPGRHDGAVLDLPALQAKGGGQVSDKRPKTDDLMDAIAEVRFWIGVNMVRFDYSPAALVALMRACLDFTKEAGE